MRRAESKTIKTNPQEKPPYVSGQVAAAAASQRTEAEARAGRNEADTPLRAIDTLNSCLRRAQGIVAVIRDGAESEATQFDNGELASALAVVFDLLDQVHDAADRLHEFRKVEGV